MYDINPSLGIINRNYILEFQNVVQGKNIIMIDFNVVIE